MNRVLAQVLVIVLLGNLFGMAGAQASADSHVDRQVLSYSLDIEDAQQPAPDAPACSHACHVTLHFVGLPAIQLSIPAVVSEQQPVHPAAAVFSVLVLALFRPPRALS